MISKYDLKCDKLSGFLYGATQLGYSLDDAWDLLQKSKQGKGILNGEYLYCEHIEGISSAKRADRDIGFNYKKGSPKYYDLGDVDLLAYFIENTHIDFNIPYSDIFKKYNIGRFFKDYKHILGNYDSKLVRQYLL